ncbi:MAG: DUF1080 domain-containing protein [Fuerstiella sp.]
MTRIALITSLAFCCSLNALAEDDSDTFLDPTKAGADYEVQGEYKGVLDPGGEDISFGLQVIALGDHKFDAVGYFGGLPGDGWAKGDKMVKATGSTVNGETKLVGETGYALIKDGAVTIVSNEDGEVGTLNKVTRKSPTIGAKPPAGAIVLFDGSSADNFDGGKLTMGDLLAADCSSKEKLGSHTMHLEFRTPFKPSARGQARGNSGVYLQSRYECQVLDSFGLDGRNNECGGIYSISEPAVNACFPPLTWQTYDIDFTNSVWEDGKKVKNARVTIRHNGIVIHDDVELTHGTPGRLPEAAEPAPLYLQGHGNPVVYRNIWMTKK